MVIPKFAYMFPPLQSFSLYSITYILAAAAAMLLQIKLTGPIECRLRMLLLTSQNVTILGGEVEHLVSTNNQKCILSRTMYVSTYTHTNISMCV